MSLIDDLSEEELRSFIAKRLYFQIINPDDVTQDQLGAWQAFSILLAKLLLPNARRFTR